MNHFEWIFWFDSTTTTIVELIIYDSTQPFCFNLNHHLWLNSTHRFRLNLTQLSDLILDILHEFESNFLFNSSISNQFESSFPIKFDSAFRIQFDWVLIFDSNKTTTIQLAIFDWTDLLWSNLTHNLWFKLTHIFQFNLVYLSDSTWHILHKFDSLFTICLSYSDSIWLNIYDSIRLNFLIWFDYNYTNLTKHYQFN